MKLLILSKYGRLAASTRHRFLQYVPYFERRGIECTVSPLLDDSYLMRRYRTGGRDLQEVARAFVRRVSTLLARRRWDLILLYCEALPYCPPILERYVGWRGIPYVLDYDDAIFHQYDLHPRAVVRWLLGHKMREVLRRAAAVFAGNEYLARYARAVNGNVHVVPTVIDLDRYRERRRRRERDKPLTIGWIGSPSTAEYLREIGGAIRQFVGKHGARFVAIGGGGVDLGSTPVEHRSWSEQTEVRDMMEFDVGIMPLPDTPWARGKSGFKLIQYMACGLPVVASPVGVNTELVTSGENGFLAESIADWLRAFETLDGDPAIGAGMGASGRRLVESRYCLQTQGPRITSLLEVIAGQCTPATVASS